MKPRLATFTERGLVSGQRFMTGRIGEINVRLEPDGESPSGRPQWRLVVASRPTEPQTPDARRNARGAQWRIQRRKDEGVESLGGMD